MNSITKALELPPRNGFLLRLQEYLGIGNSIQIRPLHIWSCLSLSLALIGSNGKPTHNQADAAETKPTTPAKISFITVLKGLRSGIREPLQIVVRSQAEWIDLWRRHANNPNAVPPTVRFDQEMVVGIFLGNKPTGGYGVTILRAEKNGDELVVYYQEKSPAPGSMLIQVFEQPFHVVRLNREAGPKVSFRRMS